MPLSFSQGTEIQDLLSRVVDDAEQMLICGSYSVNQDTLFFSHLDRRLEQRPLTEVYFFLPPFTEVSRRSKNNVTQALKLLVGLRYDECQAAYLNEQGVAMPIEHVKRLVEINSGQLIEFLAAETAKRFQKEIRLLGWMTTRNIIYFFQPLFHAKFIYSENKGYEGSANFTPSGILNNIEVYHSLEEGEMERIRLDLKGLLAVLDQRAEAIDEECYYLELGQLLQDRSMNQVYGELNDLRQKLWHGDGDLLYKLAVDFHLVRMSLTAYPWSYRDRKPGIKIKRSLLKDAQSIWALQNLRRAWSDRIFYPFSGNKGKLKSYLNPAEP